MDTASAHLQRQPADGLADARVLAVTQDKGHSAVVLKAMGRAINKTVTIGAELFRPQPV